MKWSDVDCEEKNGEILGYIVRYNSSFNDLIVEGREQYNTTLINLEMLVEYNISVAARNINGTGPFSSISTVTGISNTMFSIDLFPANCCNDIHLSTVSCSKAATPNVRHFGGIGQL